MSSRANKQQLSDEEIRAKEEQKRLKQNEYNRKSRAKKAAQKEKTASAKKKPMCASFDQDLLALCNEAKRLERNGRSNEITGKMKNAKSIINKMYADERKSPKKEVRIAKATPTAKRSEEETCWATHKKIEKISILGAEIVELNYIRCNLRSQKRENEVTPEMKNAASLFRSLDRKQEQNRLEIKIQPLVTAVEAKHDEAKHDEAKHDEAKHDEVCEVFNVNWRPTPAPRRFKLKFNIPLPY